MFLLRISDYNEPWHRSVLILNLCGVSHSPVAGDAFRSLVGQQWAALRAIWGGTRALSQHMGIRIVY